jgi:hypothetical protein
MGWKKSRSARISLKITNREPDPTRDPRTGQACTAKAVAELALRLQSLPKSVTESVTTIFMKIFEDNKAQTGASYSCIATANF